MAAQPPRLLCYKRLRFGREASAIATRPAGPQFSARAAVKAADYPEAYFDLKDSCTVTVPPSLTWTVLLAC